MNSKSRNFYINSSIIIVLSTLLALTLNELLIDKIDSLALRYFITIAVTLLFYLFLSSSLLDHFIKQDSYLKNLVDHTLHELNTPIATIKANVDMLKRDIKSTKDKKRVERIDKATDRLSSLYNSINTKIKDQIELIEKEEFDLYSITNQAIENIQELAKTKKITITSNIPKQKLFTDKDGFLITIENLLSNGIKYNRPKGIIEIYFKDNTLFVKDSGIGIDTKNLFIIFEKSYQENPTTKGFGLGLSIVKNYCDLHKIPIKIDTKKDIGTTISLDLTKIMLKL